MNCKGFGLVEVWIAMLIMSVGLLSLVGVQISNLHATYSAYWQTIASIQAYSWLEILRTNQAEKVRQNELQVWNQQNANLLPEAVGDYQCEGSACTVNLRWQEQTEHIFSLSSQVE